MDTPDHHRWISIRGANSARERACARPAEIAPERVAAPRRRRVRGLVRARRTRRRGRARVGTSGVRRRASIRQAEAKQDLGQATAGRSFYWSWGAAALPTRGGVEPAADERKPLLPGEEGLRRFLFSAFLFFISAWLKPAKPTSSRHRPSRLPRARSPREFSFPPRGVAGRWVCATRRGRRPRDVGTNASW